MAQHDYVIDNQSFPATRTDINNVLLAISSTNSGATAPSTTYANQLWYDTSENKLYIRNEDNDAWIPLFLLDQSNDVAGTLATEIDVEDASGTDTAGTSLTVKGGAGTGSGAGGSIVFQTADGGSSGSSVNAHATRVTITDDGNVGIGTTSPAAPIDSVANTNGIAMRVRARSSDEFGLIEFVENDGSTAHGYIGTPAADTLAFYTSGLNERARFLSGGGLTFNGDTAAANALDDYEEGSWTPVFTRSGTAFTTTPTYISQLGEYTKIGKFVNATCRLRFANNFGGGSGSYLVTGLPYTNSGFLQGVSLALSTIFTGNKAHTQSRYITGTTVLFDNNHVLSSTPDSDYLVFTVNYMTA